MGRGQIRFLAISSRPTARRAPHIAVILALALSLTGCPLVSDYPLAAPEDSRADPALIGDWLSEDPGTGARMTFTFAAWDDRELVGLAQASGDEGPQLFRVIASRLGDDRFLSARELGKAGPGWYLLRYRIDGERLGMSLVEDGLFEGRRFGSSAELAAFLARNLSDPRLYGTALGEVDFSWVRAAR